MHLHEVPRLMQEFRTLDKIHSDFVVPLDRRARRSSFGSPSTVRPLPLYSVCSMPVCWPAVFGMVSVSCCTLSVLCASRLAQLVLTKGLANAGAQPSEDQGSLLPDRQCDRAPVDGGPQPADGAKAPPF